MERKNLRVRLFFLLTYLQLHPTYIYQMEAIHHMRETDQRCHHSMEQTMAYMFREGLHHGYNLVIKRSAPVSILERPSFVSLVLFSSRFYRLIILDGNEWIYHRTASLLHDGHRQSQQQWGSCTGVPVTPNLSAPSSFLECGFYSLNIIRWKRLTQSTASSCTSFSAQSINWDDVH